MLIMRLSKNIRNKQRKFSPFAMGKEVDCLEEESPGCGNSTGDLAVWNRLYEPFLLEPFQVRASNQQMNSWLDDRIFVLKLC